MFIDVFDVIKKSSINIIVALFRLSIHILGSFDSSSITAVNCDKIDPLLYMYCEFISRQYLQICE